MSSIPTEAIRPIHQRDTVVLDEHRVRDEIDLYYPSTYHFVKDAFCHVKRCKHGGNCGACPANELRRYAARDTDRIGELMNELRERDNTIAFLRGQVRGLEEKLDQLKKDHLAIIEEQDCTIASLRCTIDAKTSIIARLQGDKKLPF